MIDNFSFPLGTSIQTIFVLLAITLFLVAACGDIRNRRIPNSLVIAIAILGVSRLLVGSQFAAVWTVGIALAVLFVTFILFCFRFIGGGDAKLIPATILLIGYQALLPFLFIMSICGALISIAILAKRSHLPFFLGPRIGTAITMTKLSVPYGVAIAAGAIVTLFLQTSIIG